MAEPVAHSRVHGQFAGDRVSGKGDRLLIQDGGGVRAHLHRVLTGGYDESAQLDVPVRERATVQVEFHLPDLARLQSHFRECAQFAQGTADGTSRCGDVDLHDVLSRTVAGVGDGDFSVHAVGAGDSGLQFGWSSNVV